MKTGDLVEFHCSAWIFKSSENDYVNPGIVLRELTRPNCHSAYEIMWADGRITNEFKGYLLRVGENNESR